MSSGSRSVSRIPSAAASRSGTPSHLRSAGVGTTPSNLGKPSELLTSTPQPPETPTLDSPTSACSPTAQQLPELSVNKSLAFIKSSSLPSAVAPGLSGIASVPRVNSVRESQTLQLRASITLPPAPRPYSPGSQLGSPRAAVTTSVDGQGILHAYSLRMSTDAWGTAMSTDGTGSVGAAGAKTRTSTSNIHVAVRMRPLRWVWHNSSSTAWGARMPRMDVVVCMLHVHTHTQRCACTPARAQCSHAAHWHQRAPVHSRAPGVTSTCSILYQCGMVHGSAAIL